MELVSLAMEVFQSVAEQAASYRLGQSALRYLDRTLWVVEKCARWAVPPPLDQDERPQPELVRPLPWVFFLTLIVALRIARESISLFNLVLGKPPLRSADVVMYIQSKRRYLRTLKYQGNRMMRARTSTAQPRESWSNALHSMFEFTMCFKRGSQHYGNNNTTRVSNNDEVMVVKRSKRGREQSSPAASTSETTMERLIEKMMVDLDADSDEDSSFTLTNVTSPKSDRSDFTTESDQDTVYHNDIPNKSAGVNNPVDSPFSPNMSEAPCSTPERTEEVPPKSETPLSMQPEVLTPKKEVITPIAPEVSPSTPKKEVKTPIAPEVSPSTTNKEVKTPIAPEISSSTPKKVVKTPITSEVSPSTPKNEVLAPTTPEVSPSKIPRTPNNEQKMANGRTVKSVPSKKKGSPMSEKGRRNSDMHVGNNNTGNNTM